MSLIPDTDHNGNKIFNTHRQEGVSEALNDALATSARRVREHYGNLSAAGAFELEIFSVRQRSGPRSPFQGNVGPWTFGNNAMRAQTEALGVNADKAVYDVSGSVSPETGRMRHPSFIQPEAERARILEDIALEERTFEALARAAGEGKITPRGFLRQAIRQELALLRSFAEQVLNYEEADEWGKRFTQLHRSFTQERRYFPELAELGSALAQEREGSLTADEAYAESLKLWKADEPRGFPLQLRARQGEALTEEERNFLERYLRIVELRNGLFPEFSQYHLTRAEIESWRNVPIQEDGSIDGSRAWELRRRFVEHVAAHPLFAPLYAQLLPHGGEADGYTLFAVVTALENRLSIASEEKNYPPVDAAALQAYFEARAAELRSDREFIAALALGEEAEARGDYSGRTYLTQADFIAFQTREYGYRAHGEKALFVEYRDALERVTGGNSELVEALQRIVVDFIRTYRNTRQHAFGDVTYALTKDVLPENGDIVVTRIMDALAERFAALGVTGEEQDVAAITEYIRHSGLIPQDVLQQEAAAKAGPIIDHYTYEADQAIEFALNVNTVEGAVKDARKLSGIINEASARKRKYKGLWTSGETWTDTSEHGNSLLLPNGLHMHFSAETTIGNPLEGYKAFKHFSYGNGELSRQGQLQIVQMAGTTRDTRLLKAPTHLEQIRATYSAMGGPNPQGGYEAKINRYSIRNVDHRITAGPDAHAEIRSSGGSAAPEAVALVVTLGAEQFLGYQAVTQAERITGAAVTPDNLATVIDDLERQARAEAGVHVGENLVRAIGFTLHNRLLLAVASAPSLSGHGIDLVQHMASYDTELEQQVERFLHASGRHYYPAAGIAVNIVVHAHDALLRELAKQGVYGYELTEWLEEGGTLPQFLRGHGIRLPLEEGVLTQALEQVQLTVGRLTDDLAMGGTLRDYLDAVGIKMFSRSPLLLTLLEQVHNHDLALLGVLGQSPQAREEWVGLAARALEAGVIIPGALDAVLDAHIEEERRNQAPGTPRFMDYRTPAHLSHPNISPEYSQVSLEDSIAYFQQSAANRVYIPELQEQLVQTASAFQSRTR